MTDIVFILLDTIKIEITSVTSEIINNHEISFSVSLSLFHDKIASTNGKRTEPVDAKVKALYNIGILKYLKFVQYANNTIFFTS